MLGLGLSLWHPAVMGRAPPPLDVFPAAATAVSIARLLRSVYTGPALRVRRGSDNAEQDIPYAGGLLNTVSLLAFCAATNGFLVRAYDQSGNARDIVQTTPANQPPIVTAGALAVTLNARPGIRLAGVPITMSAATWGTVPQPFTRNYVMTRRNAVVGGRALSSVGGGPPLSQEFAPAANTLQMNAGASAAFQNFADGESAIITPIYNGASSLMRKNGSASSASDAGANGFVGVQLGSLDGASNLFVSDFYELVVFASALSAADALRLERNQGAFYGIPVI
jgi:hypothetical protein